MIPFRGLLQEFLIFDELLLIWEGDSVNSLQGIVVGIPKEIRSGILSSHFNTRLQRKTCAGPTYLGDHESLNFPGMWDVRANAEIDHWSTPIHSRGGTVWDLGLDELFLVLVVLIAQLLSGLNKRAHGRRISH